MTKNPEVATVCQSFRYCPACGRERESKTDPLCCPCGFRYYFNPAAAAGGLLTDGEGRMFFIRRERDPGRGKLGIPGGFIDAGETGESAVRREIEEEIGLEIGPLDYLVSYPNTYAFGGVLYQVIDFFYVGTVENFEGITLDRSEIREWFLAKPEAVKREDFAFESNGLAVEAFVRRFVSS